MKYIAGHNAIAFRELFIGVSVDLPVEVGDDTKVWPGTHLGRGAHVAAGCKIGRDVHIGPDVEIGRGCKIQNGAQLFEGVVLEDDVFIGPHVVFTNILVPRAAIDRRGAFQPTIVKLGASIGANATILCGITVGAYAVIGAGAVVTKNVAAHAIVVGNPARDAGWACTCGQRLAHRLDGTAIDFVCSRCDDVYVPAVGGLTRR